MKHLLLLGLAPFALAFPASAQDHSMHDMPGMKRPGKPAAKPTPKPKAAPKRKMIRPSAPVRARQQTPVPVDPHAGHDMGNMPEMPEQVAPANPHAGHAMGNMPGMPEQAAPADAHAGHDMSAMAAGDSAGTDQSPGQAPAPAPIRDRAADAYWDAGAMARAQAALRREHGGMTYSQLLFNLAELQTGRGRDGYRWEAEAWVGGDRDRFVVKSEGRGGFGGGMEDAEVQVLYGRALDPYWNLRGGVRQEFGPGPHATSATLGVEGVAPYWLEIEAALFLSTKGDLLARVQGYYDQRITQDLVLQPRAEMNLAAQDVSASGIGAGLSDVELGLRLRYERVREFAPYVGVSWERKLGDTAAYARQSGDRTGGVRFVAGVRSWF